MAVGFAAQPTYSASGQFHIYYITPTAIATGRERADLIARAVCNIWHPDCNISARDGGTGRSAILVVCLLYTAAKPATQGLATVTMLGSRSTIPDDGEEGFLSHLASNSREERFV